jgi:hypothetical protein
VRTLRSRRFYRKCSRRLSRARPNSRSRLLVTGSLADCRECRAPELAAVHTVQIAALKESDEHVARKVDRVEGKVDRLIWWMMATFATSAGALLGMLLKK